MAHPSAPTDAHDQMRLLQNAITLEGAIRHRTEGLTWTLWGLLLSAIFLMYAAMGDIGNTPNGPPLWATLLWLPWVLAGAAFTHALWRTAGLRLGTPTPRPAGTIVTLSWALAIAGGLGLAFTIPFAADTESAPVAAIGIAWLVMGAANLFRATAEGRRVVLAIGAATLLAAFPLLLMLEAPAHGAPDETQARFAHDLLRASIVGGAPFLAGLWQALRG